MRAIYAARLDTTRPVLILTREVVRPHLGRVTVAPITSTIRGLSTEVPVGPANGLGHASVVSCDTIVTVPVSALERLLGFLLAQQETALTDAIRAGSTSTERARSPDSECPQKAATGAAVSVFGVAIPDAGQVHRLVFRANDFGCWCTGRIRSGCYSVAGGGLQGASC
jgi:mRNA interferase MazF